MFKSLVLFFCLCGISQAQLIPQEKIDQWKKAIPKIENDPYLDKALHSDSILFYTDETMPEAYQFQGSVHNPKYNVAAVRQFDSKGNRLPGNGNEQFPWEKPAGTDNVKNLVTLRFVYLPTDKNGVKWPVVYWRDKINGDPVSIWIYPQGTIVGELLAYYPPEGYYSYIFEIRTRQRYIDKWEMDVFRPFQTNKELAKRLQELGRTDLAKEVSDHPKFVKWRLADGEKRQRIFVQEATLDYLPEFNDKDLVAKLLTSSPFYSSTGIPWRWNSEGQTVSHAPFTKETFSIIPANYLGGMVGLSNESCTRCHQTTLHHVNEFTNNPFDGREWYGRIKGSDGIFSFNPFDPSCISGTGFNLKVAYNQKLINSGHIAHFDPTIHVNTMYKRINDYSPELYRFSGSDAGVVSGNQ